MSMALLEDLFKGNLLTAVAVGIGAVLLAPAAGQVLRPAAKAVIKGGMLAYRGLGELGEMASDLAAEATPNWSRNPLPRSKQGDALYRGSSRAGGWRGSGGVDGAEV
jgi:hypothetical protein